MIDQSELKPTINQIVSLDFDKHVTEMKLLSNDLIDHSFPAVSEEEENLLACLKQREITIDGYDILLYFNTCKKNEVNFSTIQILGNQFIFLPFSLICKIGVKFLGNKNLFYINTIRNKDMVPLGKEDRITCECRQIYVWAVYRDENGSPAEHPIIKGTPKSYEGLSYFEVKDNQIILF